MNEEVYQFSYSVYNSSGELNEDDRNLLATALEAASSAYAPYSKFKVGAAARLANGKIVKGGNQENVSFPAGLCAEGVVLATVGSQYPDVAIDTLAISYRSLSQKSNHPIAPCGICRQSLQEFRDRTGSRIRLIMGGEEGKVFVVNDASALMPLAFKF